MNTQTSRKSGDPRKLDVTAWVNAALELLATSGIDGVRVERLATMLDVTKGSFYWHFKDRDALYESMLAQWRKRATLALIERLDRGESTPQARFHRLLNLPIQGRRSSAAADVELAIRLWGRRDPRAAAALREVDELRLSYIGHLLRDCGIEPDEADARALLAYSYMRVAPSLIPADAEAVMLACEALLLGTGPRGQ